ncbi:MAG TPA: molybdopterin-dependent oxidoreductase [Pirellulaceae bacterium]|nr:molybdopterin-dependent oxidoreductase [Pirellulaceae bacterium]
MFDRRILLQRAGLFAPMWLVGPSVWLAGRSACAAPESKPGMLVHTLVPHNAEPPLGALVQSWITPNEHFYVRSHGPMPMIDVSTFRLSIEGLVEKPFKISLEQLLRDFTKQTVLASMTCAGNRRIEHSLVKEVAGVQWQAGAIGNAKWGGTRLSDLLKKAGIKEGAKHVWFEGTDEIDHKGEVILFGASIPLEKAMSDTETMPGTLVCHEMNGEPLSPDHGFPLRTVVPGYIGARSVKWLGKIIVSDRPSTNHYVAEAYKLVTEGTDAELASSPPIENFVINSVTCIPVAGSKVAAGKLEVSGYALATGVAGQTIAKVELSTDGGTSWIKARFTTAAKPYCWRLWKADVDVHAQTAEIIVRAIDSTGNVQPQTVAWNQKGYQFNAWHKTPVQVSP